MDQRKEKDLFIAYMIGLVMGLNKLSKKVAPSKVIITTRIINNLLKRKGWGFMLVTETEVRRVIERLRPALI